MSKIAGHYRLKDILKRIDRKKSTVLRWEAAGLIPTAQRDSRGWRIYSEQEVAFIVEKVLETNYFRDFEDKKEHAPSVAIPEHAVPAWQLQNAYQFSNTSPADQWHI